MWWLSYRIMTDSKSGEHIFTHHDWRHKKSLEIIPDSSVVLVNVSLPVTLQLTEASHFQLLIITVSEIGGLLFSPIVAIFVSNFPQHVARIAHRHDAIRNILSDH